jgi:hypothetical protein
VDAGNRTQEHTRASGGKQWNLVVLSIQPIEKGVQPVGHWVVRFVLAGFRIGLRQLPRVRRLFQGKHLA